MSFIHQYFAIYESALMFILSLFFIALPLFPFFCFVLCSRHSFPFNFVSFVVIKHVEIGQHS